MKLQIVNKMNFVWLMAFFGLVILLYGVNAQSVEAATDLWMKNIGTGNASDQVFDVAFNSIDDVILVGGVANYNGNPYSPAYYNADLNDDGDVLDANETGIPNQSYNRNIIINTYSHTGTHKWSKRMLNNNSPTLKLDSQDNILLFGIEGGNYDLNADGDFDDNIGESFVGYGGYDLYITSFNGNGNYVWSKRLGSTSHDAGSFDIDSSNNVVIIGSIVGDADLNGDGDPLDGNGESSINYGNQDGFITIFSSNGTYKWSKRLGGNGSDAITGVSTDSNNNVYVTGSVTGDADLNGDGDTSDTGESTGSGYFLSSFDTNGVFRWNIRTGGSIVKIDLEDNIIISGNGIGDIDLNGDGDVLDSGETSLGYGANDIFVTSFDSNKNHIWSKRFGGTSDDYITFMDINNNQDIVIAGMVGSVGVDLNSDQDFLDGAAEVGTSFGGRDIVLTSFDKTGNYIWSTRLGGDEDDYLNDIDLDDQGQVFITGWIGQDDNADLNGDGDDSDSDGGEIVIGHMDSFTSSFNASGVFEFSKRFGTIYQENNAFVAVGNTNDFVIWGNLSSNSTADINGDGDMDDGDNESNPSPYSGSFATYFRTDNYNSEGIDTIAPTGNISINGGNEYSSSVSVTLTLSATDNESGVYEMLISNDSLFTGSSWESYAISKPWTLLSGDGNKTVYIKYRDVLGNESIVYSDSIIVDSTLPTLTTLGVNGNAVSVGSTVNIENTGVVKISGTTDPNIAVKITIEQTGGICNTTSDQNGAFSCEFNNLSNGSYNVTIRITSNSGIYTESSMVLGIGTSNEIENGSNTNLPNTSIGSKLILIMGFILLILTVIEYRYIKKSYQ